MAEIKGSYHNLAKEFEAGLNNKSKMTHNQNEKYANLKRKEKEHRKQISRLQKNLDMWKRIADGYLQAYLQSKEEVNRLKCGR